MNDRAIVVGSSEPNPKLTFLRVIFSFGQEGRDSSALLISMSSLEQTEVMVVLLTQPSRVPGFKSDSWQNPTLFPIPRRSKICSLSANLREETIICDSIFSWSEQPPTSFGSSPSPSSSSSRSWSSCFRSPSSCFRECCPPPSRQRPSGRLK